MHHDPTPEPAHHHCTAPAHALRATPAPAPRMAPSLPLTVLAVALSLVALGTSAAGLALARATRSLQCALTSSILRAPALRRDPPSSLATALVDLARRHRVALFIAPVAAPIARDLPVPDALGDSLRDGVRALDAWASTRGLWLHDDDGVLRLERPVTTANFDCDDALDVCATRLERLAAVTVVRAPGPSPRVRIHLTDTAPAADALRASLVAQGLAVDLSGRTLHVAPVTSEEPAPAVRALGGDRFEVSRAMVDEALESLHAGARIVPAHRGNRVVGVRIVGVRAGSVAARLGLDDGDVVRAVNGLALDAPASAQTAWNHVQCGEEMAVTVEHRGALRTVYVRVV